MAVFVEKMLFACVAIYVKSKAGDSKYRKASKANVRD